MSEGEPKNEELREANLSRVVGASLEEQARIIEAEKNPKLKIEKHYAELEKTPEEQSLVKSMLEKMPDFLKKFGVKAVKLSADNIHFLDPEKLTEQDKRGMHFYLDTQKGFCQPVNQFIGIKRVENKLEQAQIIVHEILHLNTFLSATKRAEGMILRRSGTSIFSIDGKEARLMDLEEAIIEELTMQFDRKYFGTMPETAADFKNRAIAIEFVRQGKIPKMHGKTKEIAYTKQTPVSEKEFRLDTFPVPYEQERKNLWEMIDDIYRANSKKFFSKDDVFGAFAKASFTGRLLGTKQTPGIARLIEKTYGKGSFRRLGEKTKSKIAPKS